jgi:hypothetical protein
MPFWDSNSKTMPFIYSLQQIVEMTLMTDSHVNSYDVLHDKIYYLPYIEPTKDQFFIV